MQDGPLSKALIATPGDYSLTLLVGRRYVYVNAFSRDKGNHPVVSCLTSDVTAPSVTKAFQEVVYANPLLLQPFARVKVMIDARDFFWLPLNCAEQAAEAARAMGYEIDSERVCLPVEVDSEQVLVMIVDASLVNFIRRTFPDVVISHPAAEMVRYLMSHRSASESGVHVDLGPETMTVAVFDGTGLALCGAYHPTGTDSEAYYAVAAIKTAGLQPAEAEVNISGSPEQRSALLIRLRQFSHHVMNAVVPSAAYESVSDLAHVPYIVLISPLCE